ncbi:MAG: lrp4 [Ilumatobacteraceae bacterium]|nr:lrp4 [Ilumatobacteraceae bacterium]
MPDLARRRDRASPSIEALDDIDRKIVETLRHDARIPNKALATMVGLAPSTTLNRVRSLEHRGVIVGYRANVDFGLMGRPLQALISVRLRPKSDGVVTAFVDHVWSMPETIGVFLVSGADDAIVHVAVTDTEHLRQTVLSRISEFPGVVDEHTSLVFEHRDR